jgi:hypothetical protein
MIQWTFKQEIQSQIQIKDFNGCPDKKCISRLKKKGDMKFIWAMVVHFRKSSNVLTPLTLTELAQTT